MFLLIADTSLQTMTEQVVRQMKQYQQIGTKLWDYKIAANDLPCQVGSLLKCLMQLHGERYAHGKTREEIIEGVSDELADILSLVLFIAHELKIDLNVAWNNMLKSDQKKFKSR